MDKEIDMEIGSEVDLELEKVFLEWKKEEEYNIELQQQRQRQQQQRQQQQQRYQQEQKASYSDLVIFVCFLMAIIYCNKVYDKSKMEDIDFSIRIVSTFMQLIYMIYLFQVLNLAIK